MRTGQAMDSLREISAPQLPLIIIDQKGQHYQITGIDLFFSADYIDYEESATAIAIQVEDI